MLRFYREIKEEVKCTREQIDKATVMINSEDEAIAEVVEYILVFINGLDFLEQSRADVVWLSEEGCLLVPTFICQ